MARIVMDLRRESIYKEYVRSIPEQKRCKLEKKLDFEYGSLDVHLGEIADSMINWEVKLATPLGLNEVDVHNIKSNNQNQAVLQRRAALRKWKNKNGPFATYDYLLKVFVNAEENNCAVVLCKLLGADSSATAHNHDISDRPPGTWTPRPGSVTTLDPRTSSESREYTTLVNCTDKLELALQSDRKMAHFLNKERLITENTYDRVNNPISTLTPRQLAGLMTTDLIDKVSLHHQNYEVFLKFIRSNRNYYRDIIEILDEEYKRLEAHSSSSSSAQSLEQKMEQTELQSPPPNSSGHVATSSSSFHLDSNSNELSCWLTSKGLSETDSKIIRDSGISGRAFLEIMKDEWRKELKISFGGVRTLCALQKEVNINDTNSPGLATSTVQSPPLPHQVSPQQQQSSPWPEIGTAGSIAKEPVSPDSAYTRTIVGKHHTGILHEQLVPCATKWDTIARYIGFHDYEINSIKSNPTHLYGSPQSYLGPMLSKWVQFSPPDSRGSKDVATLEALKSAVDRAGFHADAKKLTL